MTVGEAVGWVEGRLRAAGVDSPRLDSQMLVAHSIGVDRAYVLAHTMDEFAGDGLEALCERREAREPLAYILEWREFYGRRFVVTPDVLIPRQETETLVEAALGEEGVGSVLDVGTGSGCIGVTLALERPGWQVTAIDSSEAALDVARENATDLGARVRFVRSDLFEELKGQVFDLIVSNPPYVAEGDALAPEVHAHEPHLALYSGADGLEFYRRLSHEAHGSISPAGSMIVELGDGQADGASDVFEHAGWHVERRVQDLGGTHRALVLKPLIV